MEKVECQQTIPSLYDPNIIEVYRKAVNDGNFSLGIRPYTPLAPGLVLVRYFKFWDGNVCYRMSGKFLYSLERGCLDQHKLQKVKQPFDLLAYLIDDVLRNKAAHDLEVMMRENGRSYKEELFATRTKIRVICENEEELATYVSNTLFKDVAFEHLKRGEPWDMRSNKNN